MRAVLLVIAWVQRLHTYCPGVAEEERVRLGITPQMRACIEATSSCYNACTETLNYSLDGGGYLADEQLLRALIDSAEILQATQNGLLRTSAISTMLAAVCVEACENVAEICRRIDGSDEQLITCAEACDYTADCCRQLAI
jgi:hypothetical protein